MSIAFPIPFTKMSGAGNDFILIDHREPFLDDAALPNFVRAVCHRKFSVGADGVILIENSEQADFSWKFYNGDGSVAEMCGNGARCAAKFAYDKEIAPAGMRFLTLAGEIEAQIVDSLVKIRMTTPSAIKMDGRIELYGKEKIIHSINTGVPHVVHFVSDVKAAPVFEWGREIRHHELFQPAGANANFVQVLSSNELSVRTYERGVEDETLACGTGAAAAAIVANLLGHVNSPVSVRTVGGEKLIIHFKLAGGKNHAVDEVYLEGPANSVFEGRLLAEALRWL